MAEIAASAEARGAYATRARVRKDKAGSNLALSWCYSPAIMSVPLTKPEMPPRIVHLLGGLRAVDDRSERVTIQIAADAPLVRFPTPPYPQLYRVLADRGLPTVGVEFLNLDSYKGISAPDWQCSAASGGFQLLRERREWSNVRHAAHQDHNPDIADVASRCKTYLDLLSIRLLDLSNAYNRSFRAWKANGGVAGNLFSNTFMPYIDAAVHALVSDCGSFRDLIAESVWRFVLKETAGVTTLSTFLKRAKASPDPLAVEIIGAGAPDGWLKVFTDLRNDIVHVAPMGRAQILHSCQIREWDCGQSIKLPKMHYPILAADRSICRMDIESIDFQDEESIKATLRDYMEFFDTSIDGLDYAWHTINRLVELIGKVRVASGFRSQMMVITDADLVGEPQIR